MSALTKKQALKIWNVRLKVSSEEERKIKMEAIQKGMMISEYIKQTVLNDLSSNRISDSGK
ncbi:MAG: hypothetical protein ACFBSE_13490 [Prochloraceae cyanobacterium]